MPLLTEKSVTLQAQYNTVAFRVRPDVSKGKIARAVKERYNITPLKIRTVNQLPKTRRRGRTYGQTAAWKKAYVTLPEGTSIESGI